MGSVSTRIVLFLMYQKCDIVPIMGHNFLPSSTPFSTSFFTSNWSRLCCRNVGEIDRWHRAFYPSVGGGTIPTMAYFLVFSMCQNGIKSDGRWCQKRNRIDTFDDGLSSRSMTTTAAKGANNPQKNEPVWCRQCHFYELVFPWFDHRFPIFLDDERLRPPPRSHFSRGFVRFFTHFS